MRYSLYHDVGKQKSRNEDACLRRVACSQTHMRGMAVICDGESAGDDARYAAYFVIAALDALFEEWKYHAIQIEQRIREIHNVLRDQGEKNGKCYGMRLALFLFQDDDYECIRIGDSRVYLYHRQMKQLTKNRHLALCSYEERHSFQRRHHERECHMRQCLGANHLRMEHHFGTWKQGDVGMVCIDGNYDHSALKRWKRIKQFRKNDRDEVVEQSAWEALLGGLRKNRGALLFTRGTCG